MGVHQLTACGRSPSNITAAHDPLRTVTVAKGGHTAKTSRCHHWAGAYQRSTGAHIMTASEP